MASYPSTAHSFDIRIPVAAHYGLFESPKLVFTSDFLHGCRYVAVARNSTCGEKKLGNRIVRDSDFHNLEQLFE